MVELLFFVFVIMVGIRNVLVVVIGIIVIGVFVGVGGFGDIIIWGINVIDGILIILVGVLLIVLMVIIIDWFLGILEKWLDFVLKKL